MNEARTLDDWEDLCGGTYPGYGATPVEARAYASLTEVLDESPLSDWHDFVSERLYDHVADEARRWIYEPDDRIADLANLLMHHGWTPPGHLAYTDMNLVEAHNA